MLPITQNLQLRDLLGRLDEAFEGARTPALRCGPGCDACCHGPFDIGAAEAWLLLEGIAALEEQDRVAALRRVRAQAEEERRDAGAAGSPFTLDSLGEERFDALCDARVHAACPMLSDGRCIAYDARPEACRLRGRDWGTEDTALSFSCPEGWTSEADAITFDIVTYAEQQARFERAGRPGPWGRDARTTVAQALDALLRASRSAVP